MENLYLIKCNQFYKIGIANDIESRLASLQTGNPYMLGIEACFQFTNAASVEKALHQRFSGVRTLGEWFELGENDLDDFLTLCRMLGGNEITVRKIADEIEIEEAEKNQESLLDDPEIRIEKRYSETTGELIGFSLRERNKERKVIKYIGKRSNKREFDVMLKNLE